MSLDTNTYHTFPKKDGWLYHHICRCHTRMDPETSFNSMIEHGILVLDESIVGIPFRIVTENGMGWWYVRYPNVDSAYRFENLAQVVDHIRKRMGTTALEKKPGPTVQHPDGLFRVTWDTSACLTGVMALGRYPDRAFGISVSRSRQPDTSVSADQSVFRWQHLEANSLTTLASSIQAYLMDCHVEGKVPSRPVWTPSENWGHDHVERYWARHNRTGSVVLEVVLEEDPAYTRYGVDTKIEDGPNGRLYAYALRDQVLGRGLWFPKVSDLVAFLRERLRTRAFHEAALKDTVQKATQDLGQGLRDLKDRRIAELEKSLADLGTKIETVLEALRKENTTLLRQNAYDADTIERLQGEIFRAAQRIAALEGRSDPKTSRTETP